MRVVQSAPAMIAGLQGEDLVIRPMPGSGLLLPGSTDAVVTPDGIIIVDESDNPLYFITASGYVIGRTQHVYRDSMAASEELKKRQSAQDSPDSA